MNDQETTVTLPIEPSILEMLARRRGHATIADYLIALVDKDDDLMWDEQFAATPPEVFAQMKQEALEEIERRKIRVRLVHKGKREPILSGKSDPEPDIE